MTFLRVSVPGSSGRPTFLGVVTMNGLLGRIFTLDRALWQISQPQFFASFGLDRVLGASTTDLTWFAKSAKRGLEAISSSPSS